MIRAITRSATALLNAIKTVDGSGSGLDADTVRGLVLTADHPGMGTDFYPPFGMHTNTNATIVNNLEHMVLHRLPSIIPNVIGCYVNTAGSAGTIARLIIRENSTSGKPGTLILDCGTVATDVATTSREVSVTIPSTYAGQWVWAGLNTNSGGQFATGSSLITGWAYGHTAYNAARGVCSDAQTATNAAGSSFTVGNRANASLPWIWFRRT